jgi:hypothetical protein
MKKEIILTLFIVLITINFVYALRGENYCDLNITLLNQDPYPAVPGEYVKVVLQISGLENSICDGAKIEIFPKYPFSLYEGSAVRTIEGDSFIEHYDTEWMVPYRLRIDDDAVEGAEEIEVWFGELDSTSYEKSFFEIEIEDSQTEFDAVVQDISGTEISIALANTGKYEANAVITRIPEQENFEAVGTNGQMIGNLESGDYTLVSFEVTPKKQLQESQEPQKKTSREPAKILIFQIDYTDNLGERRTVNLDIPLDLKESFSQGNVTFGGMQRNGNGTSQTNSYLGLLDTSSWTFWIGLLVVLIIIFIALRKLREILRARANKRNKDNIPEWIKDDKKKNKK